MQTLHLGNLFLRTVVGLLGSIERGLSFLHGDARAVVRLRASQQDVPLKDVWGSGGGDSRLNLLVDDLLLGLDLMVQRVGRLAMRNIDSLRMDLDLWVGDISNDQRGTFEDL